MRKQDAFVREHPRRARAVTIETDAVPRLPWGLIILAIVLLSVTGPWILGSCLGAR